MYDLMDRPVTSLNPGGHLLLWAMRHWVRAVSTSRCPVGDFKQARQRKAILRPRGI